jgi:hypothetical protein
MMDELVIEEMSFRAVQQKMDKAFRAAVKRAIKRAKNRPRLLSRRSRALETRGSFWLRDRYTILHDAFDRVGPGRRETMRPSGGFGP